jgi:hypothetical protein
MFVKKHLKTWHLVFVAALFSIVSNVQAATYTVYGTVNYDPSGSVVDNPVGQTILDTLVGKYAAFSFTVNTNAADTDISPNVLDLRNAVTSTANIAGINFTAGANACQNLDLDCKAVAQNNIGGSTYDTQLITGQFMSGNAFSASDRLYLSVSTGGNGLFDTPQIIDPFSGGSISASFALYYFYNNQGNRVAFNLSNITATPVPEPSSSAMFGAALLLGAFRLKKRLTA